MVSKIWKVTYLKALHRPRKTDENHKETLH